MTVKPQTTIYLSIPPGCTAGDLRSLIAKLKGQHDEVRVMCRAITFVRPLQLCYLRALVERAALVAKTVVLESPDSVDLHTYLSVMRFYDGLPDNVVSTRPVPGVRNRDRGDALIELLPIKVSQDVQGLMGRVHRVANGIGLPKMANACAIAVAEASENALDHANSDVGGWVAAQRYADGKAFEVAVVDLGVGIRGSLAANPAYASLSEIVAVERSLEAFVSRVVGDPGRGGGLPALLKAAAAVGRASVHIRSRDAELRLRWAAGREERERVVAEDSSAAGTSIWLSLGRW